MSGKRYNPLDDPPTASSSDEEEVESSIGEGEGDSSTEDESSRKPVVAKKPETPLAVPEKQQVSDSESGSEEETDSESETEPVKKPEPPSVVKPVAETKDSVLKSLDSKKDKPLSKSAGKKRSSSEADVAAASTDAKKVKRVSGEEEKKSGGGGEETKKNYFQRVWSEEDEIAVLQGFVDYKTDIGVSPFEDTNGFYQYVKKSISFDVSKTQFTEKIRAIKKKFDNNLGRGKNGEEPKFTKSHDRKAFDMSKLVWGPNGMAPESAVKSNGKSKKKSGIKSKKVESVKQELAFCLPNGDEEGTNIKGGEAASLDAAELDAFLKPFLVKSLACFGVDDLAAQQGWSRLPSEDKERFEEQWKALKLREFEFYSQKSGFIHEVVTKMAEAFRPNL